MKRDEHWRWMNRKDSTKPPKKEYICNKKAQEEIEVLEDKIISLERTIETLKERLDGTTRSNNPFETSFNYGGLADYTQSTLPINGYYRVSHTGS